MNKPVVQCFRDVSGTGTAQYILYCSETHKAAIIDSVWDYDADAGKLSSGSMDLLVDFIKQHHLKVEWILETHVHADHITAAQQLKKLYPAAKIAIGAGVLKVQETFKPVFNLQHIQPNGSQFDHLFQENEKFFVGLIEVTVISTPGHTPDSVSFVAEGAGIFVGDTVFQPDKGTARCDFPNGSAEVLYASLQKILSYPDATRIFVCHDYPDKRDFKWETTVGEQKAANIHIANSPSRDDFVAMRKARDATLKVPHLLLPSVQLNLDAGRLPPPEQNGKSFVKIPLTIV
jgi:glyoxylase-like metal-dependent hydrolase (beta-lactamase superfamily II)